MCYRYGDLGVLVGGKPMRTCRHCSKSIEDRGEKAHSCIICGYLWNLGKNKKMTDVSGCPKVWCDKCRLETIQFPIIEGSRRKIRCLHCAAHFWALQTKKHKSRYYTTAPTPIDRHCRWCRKLLKAGFHRRKWYCDDKCHKRARSQGLTAPLYDNEEAIQARGEKREIHIFQLTQLCEDKLFRAIDDVLQERVRMVR